ncbi:MAG: histidine triad nucleotide-binding protein [Actinobacteria bacterium]|nr:histidine triad nucleotide-binding protein [Actinomycetota bacterium]MCL5888244.1 histidine triad nucleotide-binding protein [Actinomycetota bacterium]
MTNCVFCMIVDGAIPSNKIYEDDDVIAFDDIAPQAPTHILVIPKKHYVDLSDDVPREVLCNLFSVVAMVAKHTGISESGYRVIINNGSDANQTVGHLHAHVMGGRRMSHGMVCFDE